MEGAVGCDRTVLAVLADAYRFDGERIVMMFHPQLAPYKVAVFPLMKKEELAGPAEKIYRDLRKHFRCDYDDAGSIGKRYRRQEEIGTPYCVTIDFDTLQDQAVTVRHRDTMAQDRIAISQLKDYIDKGFATWKA